jgi:dihydrodipicolinate synthase/N-acetylneuraminate lyase
MWKVFRKMRSCLWCCTTLLLNQCAGLKIDTLLTLSKHPKIVGIKDSSGDLEYFEKVFRLKEQRPDWTIMMGPEHLVPKAIKMGADGGVNGGSNVEPELFVSVFKPDMQGDEARLEDLMRRADAFQARYQDGTPGFRLVIATKCALSLKNICCDTMAEPFRPFQSKGERWEDKNILDGLTAI